MEAETCPAAQELQASPPLFGASPLPHWVQLGLPTLATAPEAQRSQEETLAKVPATHCVHSALPLVDTQPDSHGVHRLRPDLAANLPASHFSQLLPSLLKVPEEQSTQASESVNSPASQ